MSNIVDDFPFIYQTKISLRCLLVPDTMFLLITFNNIGSSELSFLGIFDSKTRRRLSCTILWFTMHSKGAKGDFFGYSMHAYLNLGPPTWAPLLFSLIFLCVSQHRWTPAIGQMNAPLTRPTHWLSLYISVKRTVRRLQIRPTFKNSRMPLTLWNLGQPQVKMSLPISISSNIRRLITPPPPRHSIYNGGGGGGV